jgi:hypothetical protein
MFSGQTENCRFRHGLLDARSRLNDKIMFGSDYPSIGYDRLLREWAELGYEDETMERIFHRNAERILAIPRDVCQNRFNPSVSSIEAPHGSLSSALA